MAFVLFALFRSYSYLFVCLFVRSIGQSGAGAEAAVAVEPFMPAPIQDALPQGVQKELSEINKDPAKLAFALNAAVIFLFAAFAAFKVASVDGDIARGWTWYEVLLR